ncbi:choice-of-anchor Q domain-containing protein [Dokdonella sp.]|uniref:choice-of-anchor Q domain-containing protein n=1 Tax=Dokdonella sp. TaxID=2291710 RepID=UPI003C411444
MIFHSESASRLAPRMMSIASFAGSKAMGLLLACLACGSSQAAIICIDSGDSASLEIWLGAMSSNGQDDEIRLRGGTFVVPAGSGGFQFFSTESNSLSISGQWNAGCTSIRGIADTVLDGSGASRIMQLYSDDGDLTVRRLLFANGRRDGTSGSAGLQINGLANFGRNVTVEQCAFFSNADTEPGFDSGSAALSAATENGELRIRNNLFVNNAGGMASAAAIFLNGNASVAYITSNTASGNGGDGALAGGFRVQVGTASTDSVFLSNNILWGNSSPDLHIDSGAVLYNNDIGQLTGTASILSAGNVSIDPGFSGGSPPSYRLVPTSPLINGGINAAPGGLSSVDFEGFTRIQGGIVDVGAYELSDVIFDDDFD